MENIDSNKLIAEIITANAESLFDSSKNFISDKSNQIKARLKRTFSEYLEGIERKYSSTKTIIYRDTPQSIKHFYEPIDLFNDRLRLESPKIQDLLDLKKPIIITGTGGSGKSTFLKYLLLNSIESTKKIPIFIELRDVEKNESTLIDFIHKTLQLRKVNLESNYLDQAFDKGNFIFLLDGFDELSPLFAQELGNEIDLISQSYSKCDFIVTSRPGQDFISWTNFIELRTEPLTLEKAISLVKRLNFDLEIKNNFIQELESNLYDSHRSFFENPLLLSIMLITYRDSASIPSELHNFYSLAFEALYYRHDASKSFKRPTLTNLPVNKGKDIMSAFSLITYLKTQTSFNNHELKDYLNKAMKLADCNCDIKDLITDLLRAFCMLLQDGTVYEYTHRSFQEYFSACYLVAASEKNQIQLIKEFSKKADTDITLQLAFGMNPKMIEEKLIIPFLTEFKENIGFKGKINKTVFRKFARLYFDDVDYHQKKLAGLSVKRGEERKKGIVSEKSLNLGITRLIIRIYNINTELEPNNSNVINPDILPVNNKERLVPISTAFKEIKLVDWFLEHSLEKRVLEELMKLEKSLQEKNDKNSELFESLLENN
ncbi:NACHT domain-containing protein [Echinicola salinicaeni]|uniref:NACHT domain-containing protein n=1 Tax=Echinicola salinicaeni TaxID=2762757 RepID=UPI00164802F2|nr:NACHT domain-containing protein [Echinicola salinicaeni]